MLQVLCCRCCSWSVMMGWWGKAASTSSSFPQQLLHSSSKLSDQDKTHMEGRNESVAAGEPKQDDFVDKIWPNQENNPYFSLLCFCWPLWFCCRWDIGVKLRLSWHRETWKNYFAVGLCAETTEQRCTLLESRRPFLRRRQGLTELVLLACVKRVQIKRNNKVVFLSLCMCRMELVLALCWTQLPLKAMSSLYPVTKVVHSPQLLSTCSCSLSITVAVINAFPSIAVIQLQALFYCYCFDEAHLQAFGSNSCTQVFFKWTNGTLGWGWDAHRKQTAQCCKIFLQGNQKQLFDFVDNNRKIRKISQVFLFCLSVGLCGFAVGEILVSSWDWVSAEKHAHTLSPTYLQVMCLQILLAVRLMSLSATM